MRFTKYQVKWIPTLFECHSVWWVWVNASSGDYFTSLIHSSGSTFQLSVMTKSHFQESGVATLCMSDVGGEKSFTICVGPAPVCDLDVIQIFSSGCWLHVHYYNAVCFGGVKHTMRHKTANEHSGLPLKWRERSHMDLSFLWCSVGHPQSVMSRGQAWSSDQDRCQSSNAAVITEVYWVQVESRKHQQKPELLNLVKT